MATTPYVRIPYASEQDRYTGRAYTAQRLALMDRQSARESAYAHGRAQRMADRWRGFGGLVTETLGGLRQSRELREAQALEQARYDAQQARLADQDRRAREAEIRNIKIYDRALLGQQASRIQERTRAGGDLSEADAETMRLWDAGSVEDYETPERQYQTLKSVAAPPQDEPRDRAYGGVQFGEPFGSTPAQTRTDERGPVRFGETFAPVQDAGFRLPTTQFGPSLVAGTETAPPTSGTRLRMTAAQGVALEDQVTTNALRRQQRERSIAALRVGLKNGVLTDTEATFALSHLQEDGSLLPEVRTKLMEDPEKPSYAATPFASIRDSLVQQYVAKHGTHPTGAALEAISKKAEADASPDAPTSYLGTTPRNLKLASGEKVEGAFLVNAPGRPHWVGPDMQPIEEEVASILPASEGPLAGFPSTLQLRDRWITESGPAEQSALQFALMRSSLDAAKAGNLAAGSQGILVTFQKILDPGSVVRESEYARSASGLALWDNLKGRIQTAIKGGAGVPLDVLEEYVALAGEFAKNQAVSTEKHRRQINAMADHFGLPKEFITSKVEVLDEWGLGSDTLTFGDRTLGEDIPDMYEIIERFPGYRHVLIPGSNISHGDRQ
jgi:hypothetical protein